MAKKNLHPLDEIVRGATRHLSDKMSPQCKHFFGVAAASVDGGSDLSR